GRYEPVPTIPILIIKFPCSSNEGFRKLCTPEPFLSVLIEQKRQIIVKDLIWSTDAGCRILDTGYTAHA
ncbi:MAG: hypothetical protein PHC68_08040, partial [Syntrophorhabdaceae bacterium]|nr:hypothetical protein [Syntrophorhabdaceae bacterium]